MKLVETHIIKKDTKNLEDVCIKSKQLYNQVIYYLRQSYFGNIEKFGEYELSSLLCKFKDVSYKNCIGNQQIIKEAFTNWKSYWKAVKSYNKNPNKFSGKPKLPGYKKNLFITIIIRTDNDIKCGYISFPKKTKIPPLKTNIKTGIKQIRIIPLSTTFKIEIVYEKENRDLNLNKENIISLDLGINNLITSINNTGVEPFIINGKPIKSFNQWYNKTKAKYQSYIGNKGTSKRILKLCHYRNMWIDDKLHKISKYVIDHCIENNIGTIVIGKNDGWKQEINIGKVNNQKFINIPHAKLIQKIQYKAKLIGIDVKLTEESYTSKVDHLAFEEMKHQDIYLGKRIHRGLFKSSAYKYINADGNGALGIGRKVFGDGFVKVLVNSRQAFCHYKVNIL